MGKFDVDYTHVRTHADIVAVLTSRNVQVVGDAVQRKACCPFHEDDRFSLSVNVEKRLFNCHSCGSSGNVIKLMQLLDPTLDNPRKAALEVARISSISALPDGTPQRAPKAKPSVPPVTPPASTTEPDEAVADGDGKGYNRPLTFQLQLQAIDETDDSAAGQFVRERGLSFSALADFGV
ncbi:MAG: CHC2 zinc finger domain-containing protein, partial [Pseudomonadota bacterium]